MTSDMPPSIAHLANIRSHGASPTLRRSGVNAKAAGGPKPTGGSHSHLYGVVVDSVNVSVFEYAPVRSASLARDRLLERDRDRVVGHRPL